MTLRVVARLPRQSSEPAIRSEIKRLYYDVGDTRGGDTHGGDAMNRALSDVLESGGNRLEREGVFEECEAYTRADRAEVAMFGRLQESNWRTKTSVDRA